MNTAAPALTMRSLLIWGLLAGLVGGLLAFGFAAAFGEPSVDRAIAIEEAGAAAHPHGETPAAEPEHGHAEEEGFTRAFQSTVGLGIGAVLYGLGVGGLFGVAFAFAYGRLGTRTPRATALALAGIGFVAVVLVPFLTYPANPPAVGNPDTIEERTALFFAMIAISLALVVAAVAVSRSLTPRLGGFTAATVATVGYLVIVTAVAKVLPGFQEVPEGFPGDLIWNFRIASLGTSAVLWGAIGVTFAVLMHRSLQRKA
ncbi:Predicted cobalt transporter CbtA [Alloactinosynnema sp. L-07]|uniref:CbtA family protein n=1 Tax=Alloactinosynnema sp. L-07 TaxID=1653480 RepID=UPI00065EF0CE|nr:Predicted cobalt transporter CbtA [Alloactinosynnema sp. L-07]